MQKEVLIAEHVIWAGK